MDELARSGGYRRRDFVRGAAGGVLGATALVGLGWAEAAMGAVVPIASLTASQRETYEALLRAGLLYERSVVAPTASRKPRPGLPIGSLRRKTTSARA